MAYFTFDKMPDEQYFDGSHFGIHSLMDFAHRGCRFFYDKHIARIFGDNQTQAMKIGRLYHRRVLLPPEEFEDGIAVEPETYPVYPQIDDTDAEPIEHKKWSKAAAYCKAWHEANPDPVPPDKMPDPKWKEGDPIKTVPFSARSAFGKKWKKENPAPEHPETYPVYPKVDDLTAKPIEDKPWNNNATFCRDWAELARSEGRMIVKGADVARVNAMHRIVWDHPDASALLKMGFPEFTIRSMENGLPIQCRFDNLSATGRKIEDIFAAVDLKSCDNLAFFVRDIRKYGYDRQAGHYLWMFEQEFGRRIPWYFIAQESSPPYRVGVFQLAECAIDRAHERNLFMIDEVCDLMNKFGLEREWPRDDIHGIQTVTDEQLNPEYHREI